jgi:hypothetical protein
MGNGTSLVGGLLHVMARYIRAFIAVNIIEVGAIGMSDSKNLAYAAVSRGRAAKICSGVIIGVSH